MSVIAEFRVEAANFAFGKILSRDPSTECELERIVPTGEHVMPYVWVKTRDRNGFESQVEDEEQVSELVLVDDLGDRRLYRITWDTGSNDLISEINRSNGIILSAAGRRTWTFEIRFSSHEAVRALHRRLKEKGINIQLARISTFSTLDERAATDDVTQEQKEALTLAFDRGYFDVPRQTTTQALADEIGISDQAFSERVRRGMKVLLKDTVH